MKRRASAGRAAENDTGAPLTLVSPSVIPLTVLMTYISLRILQGGAGGAPLLPPPPFYLLENIDYSKLQPRRSFNLTRLNNLRKAVHTLI